MRKTLRSALLLIAAAIIVVLTAVSAAALDDTYRFDEFGMSVKAPKSYYVITRDSARDDEAFTALRLDYDETLTAFRAADIYLRAYDPDGFFQLSLTVRSDSQSKTVNNYSELSDSERKAIIDALLSESAVSSAVEKKRGSLVFFDTERTSSSDGTTMYIDQCDTIVNGLQVDISIQKRDERITADEFKALENLASSLSFDSIVLKHSGPVFDWWRVLLWILILVALAAGVSIIYRQQNNAKRRKLDERRLRRAAESSGEGEESDEVPITFEEALGYSEGDRYDTRTSASDLDTFDIRVKEKDPAHGVKYFEDGGKSIDNRVDYFDTYFKEPTETRSGIARLFSTIGAYIGIFFRHIGYFFRNLFRSFKGKNKK